MQIFTQPLNFWTESYSEITYLQKLRSDGAARDWYCHYVKEGHLLSSSRCLRYMSHGECWPDRTSAPPCATVVSWSEKHCGHSCGTMQRLTPSLCRSSSGGRVSDQAVCNANTFPYGVPADTSGDKRLVSWLGFQSGTIHKGFPQNL